VQQELEPVLGLELVQELGQLLQEQEQRLQWCLQQRSALDSNE
jgi:hypothetical protein